LIFLPGETIALIDPKFEGDIKLSVRLDSKWLTLKTIEMSKIPLSDF